MDDTKPEEKSPLLFYLVESEGDLAKTHKRVNFDKGRLYGISSGATTVFTEFPNYISPCWITALLSGLVFLVMVLLITSSMSPDSIRVPKCSPSGLENLGNNTIHLVHSSEQWSQNELEILETIKREYPGYNVHLVLVHGENSEFTTSSILTTISFTTPPQTKSDSILKRPTSSPINEKLLAIAKARHNKRSIKSSVKRKRKDLTVPIGIGFGMKSLLDILLGTNLDQPKLKRNASNELPDLLNLTELLPLTTQSRLETLEEVTQNFPGLTIENITAEEAFYKSPLEKTWQKLSPELLLFAIRVIHLWEYGGLSFKIDDDISPQPYMRKWKNVDNHLLKHDTIRIKTSNFFENLTTDKLSKFIKNGKESFERLPKEVVTVDDEGLHIFTKSPCHVFFGEVLVNLRRARGDETPKRIIWKTLKVFCRHSAVGNNYCKNLIRTAA